MNGGWAWRMNTKRVMVMIGVRGWTGVFFLPVVKKSGIMLYAAMYSRLVYSSSVAPSANQEPSWDSGTCLRGGVWRILTSYRGKYRIGVRVFVAFWVAHLSCAVNHRALHFTSLPTHTPIHVTQITRHTSHASDQ
jgi:hypothetical protein